jgi:hypothetical protein
MTPQTQLFPQNTKVEFPTFQEMLDNAPGEDKESAKETIANHLRVYRPTVRMGHMRSNVLMKSFE